MGDAEFQGYDGFKALSVESEPEDCRKLYQAWSDTYDNFMLNDLKYAGHVATVQLLNKHLGALGLGKDVRILDLGCGSGLVAEELHRQGYKNMDGMDICSQFMDKAKEKGLYKNLTVGEMASEGCSKLNIPPNQYDVATCVGVLTHGHVKGKGFDDFVHVLKPGGLACFTVRKLVWGDDAYGYMKKMEELCETKKWKLLEKEYVENYICDDGCWLFCCQKL